MRQLALPVRGPFLFFAALMLFLFVDVALVFGDKLLVNRNLLGREN